MAAKKGGSRKGVPKVRRTKPEKIAACRVFVDVGDNLSEASRRTGVPVATLAGYLEDPLLRPEIERYRKAHARALRADHEKAARDAAAGQAEGVFACRKALRMMLFDSKGKPLATPPNARDAAILTKALGAQVVGLDRIRRLDENLPTDILGVGPSDSILDSELVRALADPEVVSRLEAKRERRLRGEDY